MSEVESRSGYEIFSSPLSTCEFADEKHSRAIITIPLMHVGVNDKFLEWTEEVLKEIAPMFKGIPFRYDLEGSQGSSHTPNKLFSPHFDVGWTQDAWFDDGTLWVKGEVTHPEVIAKLERVTTDGKRELNYGSMGVEVDKSICNITGKEDAEGEYVRGQPYNGKICTSIPIKLKKALHVALTNLPADGEAEIKECIFQDIQNELKQGIKVEKEHAPTVTWLKGFLNKFMRFPSDEDIYKHIAENHLDEDKQYYTKLKQMESASMEQSHFQPVTAQQGIYPSNQGMATSMGSIRPMPYSQNGLQPKPGSNPSPQEVLKELAERVKILEVKNQSTIQQNPQMPNPEVVNNPNSGAVQDNSGNFQNPPAVQNLGNTQNLEEDKNMEGQYDNKKTPVNPSVKEAEKKPETAEAATVPVTPQMGGMEEIKQLLMKILARLEGNVATADVSDLLNAKAPADDEGVQKNRAPMTISPAAEKDHSNEVNLKHQQEPEKVAMANKDVDTLKLELADLKGKFDKLAKSKVEMADNVPEFGGTTTTGTVEVASMTAEQRRKEFGDFGAFDAIFNGAQSANKYKR